MEKLYTSFKITYLHVNKSPPAYKLQNNLNQNVKCRKSYDV
jgi:hypothetical protein